MTRQQSIQRLLLISASLALLAAAALVMTLQRQSEIRQQAQTNQIMEQLCWQTARVLRQRLHEQFAAAVSETIEGIGHPELMRYELPRIATYLNAGRNHAYVDRFFLWSRHMQAPPSDEVVFYESADAGTEEGEGQHGAEEQFGAPITSEGQVLGTLYRAPALGRLIWTRAQEFLPQKKTFAVVDERFDNRQLQLLIHYIWVDERRDKLAIIIGYTVDFTQLRATAMQGLVNSASVGIIPADHQTLLVSIRDESGRTVVGDAPEPGRPSASLPLDMMFMARAMEPFRVPGTKVPLWTIAVSSTPAAVAGAGSGYWLFASVLLLIFVGLACAVVLDRQRRRFAKVQSEFVAHVSHQLKTPLALLLGAAETLGRGRVTSPEKIREYAGMVHAQASRLTALVEQAIVFSMVDAHGAGLRFEVVDVTGVVRDVVETFKRGIPDELVMRFTADAQVPLVKADPAALEQVVWNLFENAMKYGREDNLIDVRVTADNGQVVIIVADRGEGIQTTDLPRIFDQFYRGQTTAQRRGFGLGLAYVQKVVTAHGGHISVSSEAGEGAEFRVCLPAA
jgi:nitrogen-specific signal transduction histidine kinase